LFNKYPQAEGNVQSVLDAKPESDEAPKVLFGVDARKLGSQTGGGKELLRGFVRRERRRPAWFNPSTPDPPYQSAGAWDVICFNFPHVGGLSTDVNRQVRANQELLVAFFKDCVPLVSKAPPLVNADEGEYEYEDGEGSEEDEEEDEEQEEEKKEKKQEEDDDATTGKGVRTGPGQILVTLFEGEPYTLWNIKDLARHAGLVVVTSFKFPWSSYEGYSHARTVGHIEGKDGERAGWKGEDREARMYVFEVKQKEKKSGKKRSREDSSDSE
jgi:25S rRNA (uracil2634-N3)-methyltransferase